MGLRLMPWRLQQQLVQSGLVRQRLLLRLERRRWK
jgi:hypothetical protein